MEKRFSQKCWQERNPDFVVMTVLIPARLTSVVLVVHLRIRSMVCICQILCSLWSIQSLRWWRQTETPHRERKCELQRLIQATFSVKKKADLSREFFQLQQKSQTVVLHSCSRQNFLLICPITGGIHKQICQINVKLSPRGLWKTPRISNSL